MASIVNQHLFANARYGCVGCECRGSKAIVWRIRILTKSPRSFSCHTGFFNAFIYARPRFQRLKSKGVKLSFCETLMLVFLPEHARAAAGKSVISGINSTSLHHTTTVVDNNNASAELTRAEEGGAIQPMNRVDSDESSDDEQSEESREENNGDVLEETERETVASSHHESP